MSLLLLFAGPAQPRQRPLVATAAVVAAVGAAVLVRAPQQQPPARQPYVVTTAPTAVAGAAALIRNRVQPPAGGPQNLFTSQTPAVTDASDGTPGITTATTVVFAVDGTVPGIRFYATTTVSGTYTAAIWQVTASDAGTGTLLASKTMGAAPTGGTWNAITFDTPVPVTAGVAYRVGLFSGDGRYVATLNFFTTSLTNGDIFAPAHNGTAGGFTVSQGTFRIDAAIGYPASTSNSASYFVDPTFLAGSTATATTPEPYVVTAPASPPPPSAVLLRTAPADLVTATVTPQPYVVGDTPPPSAALSVPLLLRGSLFDPATPRPQVVTTPAPPTPAAAILLRSTLADPAAPPVSTPGPYVITSTAPTSAATVIVERGTLADDPVLTTRAPYVAAGPAGTPGPATAQLVRNPAAPAVTPATTSAQPYTVTAPTAVLPGQAWLVRSTLADPPVLTTIAPAVVTVPTAPAAGTFTLARNPAAPVAAPAAAGMQPTVITAPGQGTAGAAVLVRGAADPADLQTRRPVVVTTPAPVQAGTALVVIPPFAPAPVPQPVQPYVVTARGPVVAPVALLARPAGVLGVPATATRPPTVVTCWMPPLPGAWTVPGRATPPAVASAPPPSVRSQSRPAAPHTDQSPLTLRTMSANRPQRTVTRQEDA